MKYIKNLLIFFFSLLIILLVLGSCSKQFKSRYGGTLRWSTLLAPIDYNPLNSCLLWNYMGYIHIYEGLVTYKDDRFVLVPNLAKKWNVSPDGLKWTFFLREDVTFHDGTPFNAEAVVFHFKRLCDPDFEFSVTSSTNRLFWSQVKNIYSVKPYEVRFELKRPIRFFLDLLADTEGLIISPSAVKKWKGNIGQHPTGTGPFCLKSVIPNKKSVLVANKNYYLGRPFLDKIEIISTDYYSYNKLFEILAGTLDGFIFQTFPDSGLRRNPKISILSTSSTNLTYYQMNTSKPPLNDVRVRQAIRYSYNTQAIASISDRENYPATTIVPPGIFKPPQYIINRYSFDPEKAKTLLLQAGYPDGFTIKFLEIGNCYSISKENHIYFLRKALENIGITLEMDMTKNTKEYYRRIDQNDYEILFTENFASSGITNLFLLFMFKNFGNFDQVNPYLEIDEKLQKMLIDNLFTNPNQEIVKSEEIVSYIEELTPFIPYDYPKNKVVISKRIHNLILHPITGRYNFKDIWKTD